MTQTPSLRARKIALIDAIISMYHTTRMRDTPAADHVLTKRVVQDAFDSLLDPANSKETKDD